MFSLCLYLSCEHLPFLVVPLMWDWTLISYFSLIHWLLCACITIQCLALRAIILHFHRMFFFFFQHKCFGYQILQLGRQEITRNRPWWTCDFVRRWGLLSSCLLLSPPSPKIIVVFLEQTLYVCLWEAYIYLHNYFCMCANMHT